MEIGDRESRVIAAKRAIGIARHRQHPQTSLQRVIEQQASGERLADAQDFLHHLGRLESAHRSGKRAQDPRFRTAWDQAGRWLLAEEAAVAWMRRSGPGFEG